MPFGIVVAARKVFAALLCGAGCILFIKNLKPGLKIVDKQRERDYNLHTTECNGKDK